ncbi:MAG: hypothetical protein KatS3mg108_0256 [Isosphaeraceae bacterium]|nr:MAG: hypothetical protein KatS3mg108_0256 [Isosphaeraceae bacterium]
MMVRTVGRSSDAGDDAAQRHRLQHPQTCRPAIDPTTGLSTTFSPIRKPQNEPDRGPNRLANRLRPPRQPRRTRAPPATADPARARRLLAETSFKIDAGGNLSAAG